MKNRIFIAVLIVFVLIVARSVFGQSIVFSSDGKSIVLSTTVPPVIVVPIVTPNLVSTPILICPQVPVEVVEKLKPAAKQWYIVSEDYCLPCRVAKAKFLAKGWPKENVITIAQAKQRFGITVARIPYEFEATVDTVQPAVQQVVHQRQPPNRYIQWPGWGTIDLQTYNRNCNCGMCQSIRARQQEYQRQLKEYNQSQTSVKPEGTEASQESTPHEVVDNLVKAMELTPNDVLADLGCGDGRILIHAVKTTGCRGVGIEIDPSIAAKARSNISASGLTKSITIITGDALQFDPTQYAVTAISAHLYEPLLEKLIPKFTQKRVRIVATPFHRIPRLRMVQNYGVWVYKPT